MKIKCTQENLSRGLNIVSHIAGKNVSLPILNNILLSVKEGVFKLASTNLEIGIKTLVRAKIDTEGKLTVPARLLSEYVSLLPTGNIEIETKGSDMIIKAGEQETLIKGQESDEYPIIPEIDEIRGFRIGAKKFKQTLSQVIFSASYEDMRPELSGVLFTINKDILVMVATDSYRLAEKKVNLDKERNEAGTTRKIVPVRVLYEILRVINEGDNLLEIGFNENQVVFKFDETVVVSRLIEGNYPDYQEIIPNKYKTKIVIDRQNLIKTIKTASLFTKTGINDILFDFISKNNEVVISSANIQLGESKTKIRADKSEGEKNGVVFNYKYLLDGLQNINDKKIVFEINSSDSPVLIKAESDKDYLYLIMPIRK